LGFSKREFLALCRSLFEEVSLSPYTDFVDRLFAFLEHCDALGFLAEEDCADFVGWLLRQVCRHLTAYDLVTFHHRGANYPDALLLDAALKQYLSFIERCPEKFALVGDSEQVQARQRIRRRALRQAWLLRRFYEGWLVPDCPTSAGENMRVLPAPHMRV